MQIIPSAWTYLQDFLEFLKQKKSRINSSSSLVVENGNKRLYGHNNNNNNHKGFWNILVLKLNALFSLHAILKQIYNPSSYYQYMKIILYPMQLNRPHRCCRTPYLLFDPQNVKTILIVRPWKIVINKLFLGYSKFCTKTER